MWYTSIREISINTWIKINRIKESLIRRLIGGFISSKRITKILNFIIIGIIKLDK